MRNEHILDILDAKSFAELSAGEKLSIEDHSAGCAGCRQAYKAAQIGSQMLRAAAAQTFEPSPFFQARVMANLREKQVLSNPFSAFGKMWRASRTLVVMMTTIVAALIALTAFAPDFSKVSSASAFDAYSPEVVILNERVPLKEPSNEQVFQIIYESDRKLEK
jgi:hypothetical protein